MNGFMKGKKHKVLEKDKYLQLGSGCKKVSVTKGRITRNNVDRVIMEYLFSVLSSS